MSADNGYVIQMNDEGKYTLQMYFASNDAYPDPNEKGAPSYETVEEVLFAFDAMDDGYACEYGLCFNGRQIKSQMALLEAEKQSHTVEPWNVRTGWTKHGHAIPGAHLTTAEPSVKARCGGCTFCKECRRDATDYIEALENLRHVINEIKENKMKTEKYSRKPFEVEAVRVTEANMTEIAAWCGGPIQPGMAHEQTYVKVAVRNPQSPRQTEARVGDWVLKTKNGFKVYTDSAFQKNFVKQIADARLYEINVVPGPSKRSDYELRG